VRHVLPQVAPLLAANTVLTISLAIFAETYIAFLGLGSADTISWGRLIEQAFTGGAMIRGAWWAILPPGLMITALVLACTAIGQAAEDALNPRLRARHIGVRSFRVLRDAADG
jgi:peptide/nickel transport system permease protein